MRCLPASYDYGIRLFSFFVLFIVFSFFFLLIPRPPSSTLFPYTTLFRSRDRRRRRKPLEPFAPKILRLRPVLLLQPFKDRKSTRLNSSHRCISYAVFCLKKKKKKINKQSQSQLKPYTYIHTLTAPHRYRL